MPCRMIVDKITTVPKSKVGARVGRLDDEDVLRLNQVMLVFLGLAVSEVEAEGASWAARPQRRWSGFSSMKYLLM